MTTPTRSTAQAAAQRITIREADVHGKVKCNRCKKPLKGGASGDASRDPGRAGYVCRGGC